MTVGNLKKACLNAVVELKFVRRNKLRIPSTRRMLCTLDGQLLNSDEGKEILNFKAPRLSSPYNAESKGLVVVWDIIMQDWRAVPADSCMIVTAIKTQPQQQKNFWEYYNKVLSKMTTNQKKAFMDK